MLIKCVRLAIAVSLASVPVAKALAAEGSIYGGPTGGTDIRTAYIPEKPGFYISFVGVPATADKAYNNTGRNRALDVKASVTTLAAGLTYVYPFKLFGGTIDTSVQGNYPFGHLTSNGQPDRYHGFGDLYTELLGWSRYVGPVFGEHVPPRLGASLPYGLTVKLAYSMIFPVGKYTPTEPLYPGHRVFFFIPNVAATYLTPPNALGDGAEFSVHVFGDLASKNPVTQYKTGKLIDTDFALTERRGRLQAGLQGFYSKQLVDDEKDGEIVQPDGKRLTVFYLGPLVALDFPKQHASLRFKLTIPVEVRNTLNVVRYVFGFSAAL